MADLRGLDLDVDAARLVDEMEQDAREGTMPDCYEYVRRYYNVPAYVGVKVRSTERDKRSGVVVKVRGMGDQYLHVLFDGTKFHVPVHPGEVEYLIEPASR